MHRPITAEQALEVAKILKEECGYRWDERDVASFIHAIVATRGMNGRQVCREYRFCGSLGFGGKFRNNGNCENTPHVDCYREDETPRRLAMIEAANARLRELFA